MPDELVILVIVSVVMGVTLIKSLVRMVLRHRERVLSLRPEQTSGSLRTSELEAMMRRAVESSLEPVQDRLDILDRRLAALPEAEQGRRVEPRFTLDDPYEPEMPGPDRRRSERA